MEYAEFFNNIKPLALTLHIVGVIIGMGSALVSDLLFTFFSRDKKLKISELKTLYIFSKIVRWGLFIIIISGLAIFLSDIERYLESVKFMAKMTILCILLLNGFLLNKYVWAHLLNQDFFTDQKEKINRKIAFICGTISVISWIAVFILGMLKSVSLSYQAILSLYGVVLLFGIFIALLIEKKEFD